MSEACQVDEWNRTALICVLLANPNRDVKRRPRPFELHDFHPFLAQTKRQRKPARFMLDKLASFDNVQPETVTETTWQKVQT